MNKGFKQAGIMLMGIIVIAVMAIACTPKKSAEQLAMEAKILELQLALEALAKDDAEEEAVEAATPERRRERRERRERQAELQAELETAQTELETIAATPPAQTATTTTPTSTTTTTPPATSTPSAQTPAQQQLGGDQNLVGKWYTPSNFPRIIVYNSNGTGWSAYWDTKGEFSKGPFPFSWSASGNRLTSTRAYDDFGPATGTANYNISGNTLIFAGTDEYTRGEPPRVEVTSPQPTTEDQVARQQLVGTWRIIPTNADYSIFTFTLDGAWTKTTAFDPVIYTFNADERTGTYNLHGSSVNFTWTVRAVYSSGGRMNITYHASSGDITLIYYYTHDLRNDLLTLDPYDAGTGLSFLRQ
jgi:hypothetical protein